LRVTSRGLGDVYKRQMQLPLMESFVLKNKTFLVKGFRPIHVPALRPIA
jgi:hypothetical protein